MRLHTNMPEMKSFGRIQIHIFDNGHLRCYFNHVPGAVLRKPHEMGFTKHSVSRAPFGPVTRHRFIVAHFPCLPPGSFSGWCPGTWGAALLVPELLALGRAVRCVAALAEPQIWHEPLGTSHHWARRCSLCCSESLLRLPTNGVNQVRTARAPEFKSSPPDGWWWKRARSLVTARNGADGASNLTLAACLEQTKQGMELPWTNGCVSDSKCGCAREWEFLSVQSQCKTCSPGRSPIWFSKFWRRVAIHPIPRLREKSGPLPLLIF